MLALKEAFGWLRGFTNAILVWLTHQESCQLGQKPNLCRDGGHIISDYIAIIKLHRENCAALTYMFVLDTYPCQVLPSLSTLRLLLERLVYYFGLSSIEAAKQVRSMLKPTIRGTIESLSYTSQVFSSFSMIQSLWEWS